MISRRLILTGILAAPLIVRSGLKAPTGWRYEGHALSDPRRKIKGWGGRALDLPRVGDVVEAGDEFWRVTSVTSA